MARGEYKRPGVRKPEARSSVNAYGKYYHSIDMEIDNDSIWFVEINGDSKRRIPLTLETWEKMKKTARENLNARVLLRFVNKSGRNVIHY